MASDSSSVRPFMRILTLPGFVAFTLQSILTSESAATDTSFSVGFLAASPSPTVKKTRAVFFFARPFRTFVERVVSSPSTRKRGALARIDAGENIRGQQMIMAFGTVRLQDVYGENPVDTLPVHTVRVGDVALVTQPCELYCQFGLEIKRRSPAPLTAVVGLADGFCGYCPTIYGVLGIDPATTFLDHNGRPQYVLEDREPVAGLVS